MCREDGNVGLYKDPLTNRLFKELMLDITPLTAPCFKEHPNRSPNLRNLLKWLKENQPQGWNPEDPPNRIVYELLKQTSDLVGKSVCAYTALGSGIDRLLKTNLFVTTDDRFVMVELTVIKNLENDGHEPVIIRWLANDPKFFLPVEVKLLAVALNPTIMPEDLRCAAKKIGHTIRCVG